MPTGAALLKLIGSPDLSSKRWVYEQYDSLILGNTVQGPGGGAAVIRLGDGPKGLALTTDCTERYCEADPREGGRQAVAEAWRNLVAVGAKPLALTDNLNFGNPEKAHAMGQLVGCIEGIGEAARALDFPIVSGNVSLYNETMGVGHSADAGDRRRRPRRRRDEDRQPRLQGAGRGRAAGRRRARLARSLGLARVVAGREEGAPPPVDLAAERRNGEFVRALIATAASPPCRTSPTAASRSRSPRWRWPATSARRSRPKRSEHAFFFGEDQGRYVLSCKPAASAAIEAEAKRAGVPLARIGMTGGAALTLGASAPVSLAAMREAYESWFPNYMDGKSEAA